MTITTVIFDLYGTLVDSPTWQNHRAILTEIAGILSVPAERFIEEWNSSYPQRARGELPSTEAAIVHLSGLLGADPDEMAVREACRLRTEYTRMILTPRPDEVPTIERLRSMGLTIGLITDCSPETSGLWEELPFASIFDATIFSCAVGVKKPDPEIYGIACSRLEVRPEAVLYVGDGSSQELTGAQAVGMRPVLIDAPHERNRDTYRIDEQSWDGVTINVLSEIPDLVERLNETL
jgi:putative hydrolase of the HAD superfamily